jgi:hypothetical protein
LGQTFHGVGVVCGAPGNPIACCPANFNQTNGVEIQDLFDFLTAWFAHSMSADFNHDNTLSTSDVWAFTSAWYAGCP